MRRAKPAATGIEYLIARIPMVDLQTVWLPA
jgi:hypothetical protein